MNDESDDLAGSLRELASAARRRQGPDAHPSPETLTAYHAGELTAAGEEDVQEHLAVCRHCTRLLLDLPAFLEAPAAGLAGAGEAADASWPVIRTRLPGAPAKARRQPKPAPGPAPARRSAARQSLVWLAAAVLVALIAAPLWIIASRLSAPEPSPQVVELYPAEELRGRSAAPPPAPARVNAEAGATALLLHLAKEQSNLRFRVELRTVEAGSAGARSRTLPVAKVVDSRTLLLMLARREVSPGRYQLLVLDAERASAEPLGNYPMQVVGR